VERRFAPVERAFGPVERAFGPVEIHSEALHSEALHSEALHSEALDSEALPESEDRPQNDNHNGDRAYDRRDIQQKSEGLAFAAERVQHGREGTDGRLPANRGAGRASAFCRRQPFCRRAAPFCRPKAVPQAEGRSAGRRPF
jgi:hypothetical protein